MTLPQGVVLRRLTTHRDDRGTVTELFRNAWSVGVEPLQWTLFTSQAAVMRGMHMHPRHDDYIVLLQGRVCLGLRDERPGSPTAAASVVLRLDEQAPTAVTLPHGVLHGLLFESASVALIGASHYYDRADELGCHWRDPALRLDWPIAEATLSPGDAALPPLRELRQHVPPWAPG